MVRSVAIVVALFVGVLDVSGVRVVHAQEDSWSAGAAMHQARARGASCVLNDRIHIIGGSSAGGGRGTNDNQEYNPATDFLAHSGTHDHFASRLFGQRQARFECLCLWWNQHR